ncbi:MAG: bifunctional UDP-N-acetylglucosamine diphosphorylase/glucosamine-1-phosphate N-acetyltransferase GlmU, partial [Bacteriovoracaceae bacterium]|nr:bifunctional UDP-N-acetylglucosamine diphosphorylase/glucosamine-1-phosphate N-acetyltransferase GlmU [Bacteriovoracaceae bacterium]
MAKADLGSIAVVVLAAGKGTRLKVATPKPLLALHGQRIIDFPLHAVQAWAAVTKVKMDITVVLGHQKAAVQTYLQSRYPDLHYVIQTEQRGTGDAVKSYLAQTPAAADYAWTLIMCADTPLIRPQVLAQLAQAAAEHGEAQAATFTLADPTGYGRIVRQGAGIKEGSFKIVEEKDASPTQKQIKEVNAGLYLVPTAVLIQRLAKIDDQNKAHEFYLTDIFTGTAGQAILIEDGATLLAGVNDMAQLSLAGKQLRMAKIKTLQAQGVEIIDPDNTYIEETVQVAAGAIIHPGVHLEGRTTIGANTIIEAGSILKNMEVEEQVVIKAYCYLEDSKICATAQVGPFAHLRPQSVVGPQAKVGNFVELKKATLLEGAKVSHLSYVGDAEIGRRTNIGCGFITCNYDGAHKHFTKIGDDCFIGSDSQMIAPVEIGDQCFVASGSTINKSMPPNSFAISRG